jgi:hypothetical protein
MRARFLIVGKKFNLPLLPDAWSGRARDYAKTAGEVKGEKRGKSDPGEATASDRPKKPSLDDARNRLGGRTKDEEPAPPGMVPGRVVRVFANDGAEHVAVVVFANPDEVHILIDGTKLRRVPPSAVHAFEGEAPSSVAKIAADAHVFSRLAEGEKIRYADDSGGLLAGKLVEKCRYGALVVREDGAVVAVGFRKLWPAASVNGSRGGAA